MKKTRVCSGRSTSAVIADEQDADLLIRSHDGQAEPLSDRDQSYQTIAVKTTYENGRANLCRDDGRSARFR